MVKDTVEKPDEEKHGVRSGRCQVQELLCPWNWGISLSWCGCIHQLRSSLKPVLLGSYGKKKKKKNPMAVKVEDSQRQV